MPSALHVLLASAALLGALVGCGAAPCACEDSKLCQPLAGPKRSFEFVAFCLSQAPSTFKLFDWEKLTTLVINSVSAQTPAFVCYARARGVRVTLLTDISVADLGSNATRAAFVNRTLATITANKLDGVNMDFESSVAVNSSAYNSLTVVMRDLKSALAKANPRYTLSMDYVFCAQCVSGRTYDYMRLATIVDYFVIMDYDLQGSRLLRSSIAGLCSALSNSPLPIIHLGTRDFLNRGVPASKLVLAFPWYGYRDPCTMFIHSNQTCYTDCSNKDKGDHQFTYANAMGNLRGASAEGRQWNTATFTPSFTYVDSSNQRYQYNYDDPWSLKLKYNLALSLKLRGVGTWHVTCLDFSNDTQAVADRELMWGAIPTGL